jgi:hypothetical protein
MNDKNKAILKLITQQCTASVVDEATEIELKSGDICDLIEKVQEVWYSPSGNKRDDMVSVGFIKIPYCTRLDEFKSPKHRLSVLSTRITEQFHNDWNKVVKLPMASTDHQLAVVSALFISDR